MIWNFARLLLSTDWVAFFGGTQWKDMNFRRAGEKTRTDRYFKFFSKAEPTTLRAESHTGQPGKRRGLEQSLEVCFTVRKGRKCSGAVAILCRDSN